MVLRPFVSAILMLLIAHSAIAQSNPLRERAKQPYQDGLQAMGDEAFEQAAKAFQTAIDIDPDFEMAYYMLGRTQLVLKNYVAAVQALARSRDLYVADAMNQFSDKQEGQRLRRERLAELDQLIVDTQAAASLPQNATQRFRMLEQVRQYQERKRQIQDLDRDDDLTPARRVPAYVSLSLGSAYFRARKLPEAEQAYLAAVAADPKVGEAHSNLAVLYMETGRLDEADKAVKAAEKTGLRVNPALKEEIARRKKS